ncbi:MAG TPA: hypothetical protein VG735_07920 [Caulobacterales bacterium]|nr:hypothetical protein [Caulobacterales bacterium]
MIERLIRRVQSWFAWHVVLRRVGPGPWHTCWAEYRQNDITGARKVDRYGEPLTPADRAWIAEGGLPPDFTLTPPSTFSGGWR